MTVYFGCLFLAAWIGGDNQRNQWFSPERAGVITILAMFLIQSVGYGDALDSVYRELDLIALTSDIVGLAGFTLIALYASRIWSLFSAGIQLIALLTHFVRLTRENSEMAVMAYNLMKGVPTIAVALIVLLAAALRWRKVRRGKPVRDWVPWRKYERYRALQNELSDF
ncbi:hypothetical protein [Erythrobacter sp.]